MAPVPTTAYFMPKLQPLLIPPLYSLRYFTASMGMKNGGAIFLHRAATGESLYPAGNEQNGNVYTYNSLHTPSE